MATMSPTAGKAQPKKKKKKKQSFLSKFFGKGKTGKTDITVTGAAKTIKKRRKMLEEAAK